MTDVGTCGFRDRARRGTRPRSTVQQRLPGRARRQWQHPCILPRILRLRPFVFSHPSAIDAPASSPGPAVPAFPRAAVTCGRRFLPWASRLRQGDVGCAVVAAASWLHPGRRSRRRFAAFRGDLRVGGTCRRPDAAPTVRATDNVVNKCANRTCGVRHTTPVLLQRGKIACARRCEGRHVIRASSTFPAENRASCPIKRFRSRCASAPLRCREPEPKQ